MRLFSGLKLNIAGTVISILVASMVLGNFVTVMFWKKNMVDLEIEKIQNLTNILSILVAEKLTDGEVITPKDIVELFVTDKNEVVSVALFNGRKITHYPVREGETAVQQVIREAGLLQKDVVKIVGNMWGIFSSQNTSVLIAHPLIDDTLKKHALCVEVSLKPIFQALMQDLKTVFVYLFVNVIILFVIGWFRLVKMVVKPIERMVSISESHSVSDSISFNSKDFVGSEFGQLSMALNSMLIRIEMDREELQQAVRSLEDVNRELVGTQKEMILAEKMASVGRLAAGMAHEIGNPLGIVQGYVELMKQPDLSSEDRLSYGERAMGELGRVNALIRQLLDFARTSKFKRRKVSLGAIFEELRAMLLVHKKNIVFELNNLLEDDNIKCDNDGLRQVFLNCLLNSVDAIEMRIDAREGLIVVTLAEEIAEDGKTKLIIRIEDNGIGVGEGKKLEYFEPFYTTKEPGKGTGLGLSVSHSIIEAHEGSITIEGELGVGAVVILELPYRE